MAKQDFAARQNAGEKGAESGEKPWAAERAGWEARRRGERVSGQHRDESQWVHLGYKSQLKRSPSYQSSIYN